VPDITFDYVPSTGSVLVPDGFNGNLYQQTAGKSLFETLNGNVTYPNLNAAFKVESHLIRPGQTGVARSDGRIFSADYFSDLWAGRSVTEYTPIGGACITMRIPYDVSYALFSASVFLTVWRQFGIPNPEAQNPFANRLEAAPVKIQTFFGDEGGIVYTRRELPQTVFFDAAGAPVADVKMLEQYTCHHYNLLHAKIAGKASPNDQLTAGYATFGLAVYVPQNRNGSDTTDSNYQLDLKFDGANDARPASYYSGINRVRTYVRNVTVGTLL
jgi:hypothetical protein